MTNYYKMCYNSDSDFEIPLTNSALNRSWFCWTNETAGFTNSECYFNYVQQFQRTHCAHNVDLLISAVLLLVTIPANVMATASYLQYRRELFLLMFVLAVCNILQSFVVLVKNILMVVDESWLLGHTGCSLFIIFAGWLIVFPAWVVTLIGFERRYSVIPRSLHYCPKTNTFKHDPTHFAHVAWSLFGVFCLTAFMLISFELLGFLRTAKNVIENNGVRTEVEICTVFDNGLIPFVVIETSFSGLGFVLPVVINIWNYASIYITVRNTAYALNGTLRKRHQREVNLAYLSALIVAVFVACTLPIHCVIATVAYERLIGNRTTHTSHFWATYSFLLLRGILNPLITSFFTLRRRFVTSQALSQFL